MNIPPTHRKRPGFAGKSQSGLAIVLVLLCLVLLSILIVGFLNTTRLESSSSRLYASGVSAKLLTENAVNTVMAQIRQGTLSKDAQAGSSVAWMSQPGMIRTFDDSGSPTSYYKLYSWDNMVGTGVFNATDAAENPPATWADQKGVFTDLNEPVNKIYPIISGVDKNGAPMATIAGSKTYDGNGDGVADVEGFSILSAVPATSSNPVPMPVKWLYVLRDGKTVPAQTDPGSPTAAKVTGATKDNPIVGRMAFWTDDESCKVNVNTASEGIFWDTPVAASKDEMNLATNLPVQNEFQRIPGHPAMTCLSSIFTDVPVDHGTAPLTNSSARSTFLTNLKTIYDFTPRISWGNAVAEPAASPSVQGSLGGTFPISDYSYPHAPANGDLYVVNSLGNQIFSGNPPNASGSHNIFTPKAIENDGGRLFATVDDIIFKEDRTPQNLAFLTPASLRQNEFFLTANSRAPEVTLFNTPRVSLWPITWPYRSAHLVSSPIPGRLPGSNGNPAQPLSQNPWMAPQEKFIAFCATLNQYRYFFQRQSCDSPTYDYANIPRNQDLLGTYLYALTGKNIPGFGGSFSGKYSSSGRDAILVDFFNMIRGSVNLTTLLPNGTSYDYAGVNFRSSATAVNGGDRVFDIPHFQVAPIQINLGSGTKKGLGLFPVFSEASLQFVATKRFDPWPVTPPSAQTGNNSRAGAGPGTYDPTSLISATQSQTREMRMVLILQEFLPTPISAGTCYWVKATRVGGASFQVDGSSINFPAASGNIVQMKPVNDLYALGFVRRLFRARDYPKYFEVGNSPALRDVTSLGGNPVNQRWEFVSDPIPVNPDGTTFNFEGSVVQFDIYAIDPNNLDADTTAQPANLVQSVQMDFSKLNGALATPLAPRWVEGQIVPKSVRFDPGNPSANPAGVRATTETPVAETYYVDANQSHPEVAPKGYYLYQDEGFDGSQAKNSKFYISPQYYFRMVCACDGNYSQISPNTSRPDFFPYNGASSAPQIFGPYDTIVSMGIDPAGAARGDARVVSNLSLVPSSPSYYANAWASASNDATYPAAATYPRTTTGWQRHTIGRSTGGIGAGGVPPTADPISLTANAMAAEGRAYGLPNSLGKPGNGENKVGVLAFGRTTTLNAGDPLGDWTNNMGNFADGCTIWLPDQFYQRLDFGDIPSETNPTDSSRLPYFTPAYDSAGSQSLAQGYFSPNRQVSSGIGLFGTLSSPNSGGTIQPWQTLLFSPIPAAGASHPGFGTIGSKAADHLLLDLFWMPVAEPYAISEPLSTAGKINLNYQIVPFSYIKRQTGLYAAMKSTKVTAIRSNPSTMYNAYKNAWEMRSATVASNNTRLNINVAETLKAFDTKFASNDVFRSASQICEMLLIPQGQTTSTINNFWNNMKLTGDNSRETPYNHLYPRLTTKSNTYQVHYRVEVLAKSPSGAADVFDTAKGDRVAGEYRGSSIIERYVDPNDPTLPDFATNLTENLDKYYRFRVVSTKAFQP